MSFWNYLISLSAIVVVCSSEIGPGHSNTAAQGHLINEKGDKADVRIYYECRCYASKRFYNRALNGTMANLASSIDLRTYPYGNAEKKIVNGKTEIVCQHGPEECYGNKLHACAIDIINNTTLSVFYNACLMSCQWGEPCSKDRDAMKCGQLMGIGGKSIIECAQGEKGEKLLEYYGDLTDKEVPNKPGVPWVLINKVYYDGPDTVKDFTKAICDTLTNPPPQCHS